MPYIKQVRREQIYRPCEDIRTSGELNFVFTSIAKDYILNRGETYQTYNDIIGALEGCKLELYRRMTSNYEDTKIKENGDVYNF